MNPTSSIFVAAILLLASTNAEAARGTEIGNRNMILPTNPPISTASPQTNPIGSVLTGRDLGVLPGAPGSPTYNSNAAPPSLNNPGSAFAPAVGTSAPGSLGSLRAN